MKDVKTEHLSAFQETWQSRLRKNRETCEFIRQPKSQLGKQKNQGILENVLPPCAGTSTPAAAADSPSDRGPAGIDGAIDSFLGRSTFVGDAPLCAFRRCFHALNSTGSRRSSPRPGISGQPESRVRLAGYADDTGRSCEPAAPRAWRLSPKRLVFRQI
jgi:hypothetical protein